MKRSDSHFRLSHELDSGDIVVIKVGTSSLLRPEHNTLNLSNLAGLCETVKQLKVAGHHVIIVSSGAVGVGCQRLGLSVRPSGLAQKQALAAVGQVHLMRYYDDFFSALGLRCAQVLLTQDNLSSQGQYTNAANTFAELLRYGTIPVVNENDTVAVEQLRFGDNDTLSAQVAALVHADWLFLLTDVSFLYTANPNVDPQAKPILEVHDMSELAVDTSSKGSQWGTGGMVTKLTAGRIATAAGCKMVICNAQDPRNISAVMSGQPKGTVFHALPQMLRGRKRWLLSVPLKGSLWLDDGAVAAVRDRKKSLFSAGIVQVSGDFAAHDAVQLCDASGVEFARGLCNYNHEEVGLVKGKPSRDIPLLLGYSGSEEIVHRDQLCLLARQAKSDAVNGSPAGRPSSSGSLHGSSTSDAGGRDTVHSGNMASIRNAPKNTAVGGVDYTSNAAVLQRLELLRARDHSHTGAALPAPEPEQLTGGTAEHTVVQPREAGELAMSLSAADCANGRRACHGRAALLGLHDRQSTSAVDFHPSVHGQPDTQTVTNVGSGAEQQRQQRQHGEWLQLAMNAAREEARADARAAAQQLDVGEVDIDENGWMPS